MVEVVPLLLTWYSPYASVNQLNEVEKPSREDGERAKEKEREADWGKKKKREPCCVKGQYVVFGIITGCWFCVAEGENSTTQSTKVLSKMLEAENQSLFRSYHAVSNLHTHTQQRTIPALKLQTLSTQLCAAGALFAQQREQELLLIAESSAWLKLTLFRVEDSQLTDGIQWLTQGAVLRC